MKEICLTQGKFALVDDADYEQLIHRDGDTLNNQRYNLRNCTKAQNQQNRGPQMNATSGHKNIYWHEQDAMWRVRISAKGHRTQGNLHHSIEDAIAERDELIKRLHGDFARTEPFHAR